MGRLVARVALALSLFIGVVTGVNAEAPHGSITIDRIAQIKTPSSPAWSPDGTRVAFLWDAAGKQDLFVASPGQAPTPLTDHAVNPDTLESNIGEWEWLSNDRIVFTKDGGLWTISLASPARPTRLPGIDA